MLQKQKDPSCERSPLWVTGLAAAEVVDDAAECDRAHDPHRGVAQVVQHRCAKGETSDDFLGLGVQDTQDCKGLLHTGLPD